MRKFLPFLFVPLLAVAQPLPPATTPYTRQFLTNTSIQGSLSALGFTTTNTTSLTNASFFTSQFDVQTGLLHIKSGVALTNPAIASTIVAPNAILTISNVSFSSSVRSNIAIGAGNDMSIATNAIMIGEGGSAIAGSGIHIGNGGGSENESIGIGNGAASASQAIALGDQCDAQAVYSIAIGKGIEIQPGADRTIVISTVGGDYGTRSNNISLGSNFPQKDNQTVIGQTSPNSTECVIIGKIIGDGNGITNLLVKDYIVAGSNITLSTNGNVITISSSGGGSGSGMPTQDGNATNATFYANDGKTSVATDGRVLADSSDQLAVEWGNRTLDSSGSAAVLDWGNKQLLGNWAAPGNFTAGTFVGDGKSITNIAVASFTYSEPFPAGGVSISINTNAWTTVPLNQTNIDTAFAFIVTSTNTLRVTGTGVGLWSVRGNMQIFQTSTCVCRLRRLNNTPADLIVGETAYNDNTGSLVTSRCGLDGYARFASGDILSFEAVAEATPNQMGTGNLNANVREVFATLILEKK